MFHKNFRTRFKNYFSFFHFQESSLPKDDELNLPKDEVKVNISPKLRPLRHCINFAPNFLSHENFNILESPIINRINNGICSDIGNSIPEMENVLTEKKQEEENTKRAKITKEIMCIVPSAGISKVPPISVCQSNGGESEIP